MEVTEKKWEIKAGFVSSLCLLFFDYLVHFFSNNQLEPEFFMDNTQNPAPASSTSMTDEDKMTQAIASSYVDDYAPPTAPVQSTSGYEPVSQPPASSVAQPQQSPTDPVTPPASVSQPMPMIEDVPAVAAQAAMPPEPMQVDTPAAPVMSPMPVMTDTPTVATPPVAVAPSPSVPDSSSTPPASSSGSSSPSAVSQSLEDQNIFFLLGLESASDSEKESFLDELQQIIWEDFLENDVELLVTEEEMVEFKKISDKPGQSEEEKQAGMIDFLEKLIPDLEKIMLEKALELKEEMFRERIKDMQESFADRADVQTAIKKANDLIASQQWRAAADELNVIK
jgi:hypothetical protein